ncbi:homoserine O-acetyltransferase [Campylobacter fetus subsp. venerealis]|uniref:homoserine O-acetyltransferase MetX n=1 Tax=Campylobacter fetus TaxID=196 RepID=UPI0018E7D312|nr:homoserine O-acetyltransferase [Campylobacter fetus]QQF51450.1 homoserine O-acetyltransferase [Campylobacter fetus subsp. venerealis]
MEISTRKAHFDEPLYLESGRILSEFDLVYETYGELNADKSNAIVVCHALTGSHHAAGRYEGDSKAGWWDALIGDNKGIDTTKFFVICVNILGSSFGSTNPLSIEPSTGEEYRLRFPVLVISDVVKAQMRLFDRLGIKQAHAVIGGSLGGMQALCFAIEFPNFAKNVIMLATTYATKAWAIAFNKIAIEGIVRDPDFKNGYYDKDEVLKNGLTGMALGRMAGHISFLSPSSMDDKFGRNYVQTDGLYELLGRFEVDRYMEYNGHNFPKRFDPLSYLYITKMMNNFDCTRHYNSLKEALSLTKANILLISFDGDILFPPYLMKEMYDAYCDIGRKNQVKYICINSSYGHDAFLVEVDKIDMYIKKALECR